MGKRGPKRKIAQRYPSGQIKRPTTARALNDRNKQIVQAMQGVVLMQPHRRGSEAKEAASALGRFWLRMKTDNKVIFHAGDHYAGLVRRWRAAHGLAPAHPLEEPDGGVSDGPAWSTVQGWLRDIRKIERLLDGLGARSAVDRIVIDDLDPPNPASEAAALMGLHAIALEVRLVKPDHPFR
jgi:hypothetical protein